MLNKVSQNLHTEMVLREVARVRRGNGSLAGGLFEIEALLDEIGVERGAYKFHDASGLSRLNRVSPAATVRLLRHMYASPARDTWVGLLPVGGVDGTLDERYPKSPLGRWVHAKTGTISHVSALSGYLLPPDGRSYVFSIMVNGYTQPASEVRALVDKILVTLLERNR